MDLLSSTPKPSSTPPPASQISESSAPGISEEENQRWPLNSLTFQPDPSSASNIRPLIYAIVFVYLSLLILATLSEIETNRVIKKLKAIESPEHIANALDGKDRRTGLNKFQVELDSFRKEERQKRNEKIGNFMFYLVGERAKEQKDTFVSFLNSWSNLPGFNKFGIVVVSIVTALTVAHGITSRQAWSFLERHFVHSPVPRFGKESRFKWSYHTLWTSVMVERQAWRLLFGVFFGGLFGLPVWQWMKKQEVEWDEVEEEENESKRKPRKDMGSKAVWGWSIEANVGYHFVWFIILGTVCLHRS
jgi:hypothetical protein